MWSDEGQLYIGMRIIEAFIKYVKRTLHWLFSAVKTCLRKTNETALKSGIRVKILIIKFIEKNVWEGT